MEQPTSGRDTCFTGEDEALFQRVWERVTGARAPGAAESAAGPADIITGGTEIPCAENDTLCEEAVTLAAEAYTQEQQKTLHHLIDDELRCLARCRAISHGRIRELEAVAAEDLAHAKRLSALLFLFFGIRYFPRGRMPAPCAESVWSGIRELFAEKQTMLAHYLDAAESAAEPALRALYEEIALEKEAQMTQIRRLAERGLEAGGI